MSETMIERVAQAICRAENDGMKCHSREFIPYKAPASGVLSCSCSNFDRHRSAARAAIAAMREPSDKMVDAMGSLDFHSDEYNHTARSFFHEKDATGIMRPMWQLGIDAALAEGGQTT